MMRTVHLYGSLAEEFGSSFRLAVRSLAEAARALGCQIKGFRKAIEEGRFKVVCGRSRYQGLGLSKGEIDFGLPAGDLHITPVVRGAKNGGIGKIIVGVLIAAVAFWAGAPSIAMMGIGLAISGVSTLLTAKKKAEKQRQSYMFDGAAMDTQQGNPVPLAYGDCLVPATLISAGVSVADGNGLISGQPPIPPGAG